jgi:hypothetical protein
MALLLVDTAISGYENIVAAAKSDVVTVLFDRYSDTFQTIQTKISDALGDRALTLCGIAQHGDMYAPYYKLVETQAVPAQIRDVEQRDPALESWSELRQFYRWLSERGVRTIDLISCALWANPGWVYALGKLEAELGIDFRASVNNTGNIASGGDWIQESDGVNIAEVYFTDAIVEFVGLLYRVDSRKSSQMVCAPGATINGRTIKGSITTNTNIRAGSLPENLVMQEATKITVNAWGDTGGGGSNTQAIAAGSGIIALASTNSAFAALKSDGTVRAWGETTLGGNNTQAIAAGNGIVALASTDWAFAALKSDGTVRAWGDTAGGGNNTQAIAAGSGIIAVASTSLAFAALKSDGTVRAWGSETYGGNNIQAQNAGSGFVALVSNHSTFAGLKSNGTVGAWGSTTEGGSVPLSIAQEGGFVALASTQSAYAALRSDGTVRSWGFENYGGSNSQALAAGSGIVALASTNYAFAVLKSDRTVRAWGNTSYGGDNSQALAAGNDIVAIASTTEAFAVLKSDGTLRVWGTSTSGGSLPPDIAIESGFIAVASTSLAFAALKSDGTVRAWGSSSRGGDNASALAAGSGIVALASNIFAFAALKSDGTVRAWGDVINGGSNAQALAAGSGIVAIASTGYAFAALKPTPVPTDASSAVSTGFVGNFVSMTTNADQSLSLSIRLALNQSSGTNRTNGKLDFIKSMRDRLQSSLLQIPSSDSATFKNTILSGSSNILTSKAIDQYFPTLNVFETRASVDITNIPTDLSKTICIELPINMPTDITTTASNVTTIVKTVFFDGTNVRDGSTGISPIITVGSTVLLGSKTLSYIAVGSLVGVAGPPPSNATQAISTGLTYNYVLYSSDSTSTLVTNTRAAIKASSGTAQSTAKTDYINAMIQRIGSNKFTLPSTSLTDFKNTMISGSANLYSTLEVLLYYPTISGSTSTLAIDDLPTDRSMYACIELPYNIPVSLTVSGSSVGTVFFDGTNVRNGSTVSSPIIAIGSSVTFGSKTFSYTAVGSLVGVAGAVANATQAVSSGLTYNYIIYSTDTNSTLAIDTRAAIKASSGTAQSTAKTDYINAMIQRVGTFISTIPSAQLTDFKNTLISGASNLSQTKDVLQYFPTLGPTSGTLDIESIPVDQSKYACIELPYNLPVILTISGNTVRTLFFDGTNVRDGSTVSSPILGSTLILGTKELRNLALGSLTGLGFSAAPSALIYANSAWIAGNSGGQLRRSTDGRTWSVISISLFTSINYIAYNGLMWLIAGGGTETIAYSYDGVTWSGTSTTVFSGGVAYSLAWNGRLWVAGGSSTTNKIAYSYDGIVWIAGTNAALTTDVRSVTWSGDRWLAVGSGTNTLASSPDGITWTGISNTNMTSGGLDITCTRSVGSTYIQQPSLALGQSTSLNIGIITYNWTYQTDPALTSFTFSFTGRADETLAANIRSKTIEGLAVGQSYAASIRANFGGVSSTIANFQIVNL